MKLGYLAPLSEEECKIASGIGYDCLEAQCRWKPEELLEDSYRRSEVARVKALLERHNLSISALAVYGAVPQALDRRADAFRAFIRFCAELGVPCITALTNSDPLKTLDQNLDDWAGVFSQVAPVAEGEGVKIAFENWPGLRSAFPPVGSVNFAFNPLAWQKMFERVPSPALGLEFDPSHLVWQGIDWAAQLRRWADRIHHVHAKDTEIFDERLKAGGFFSGGWWRYRLPGYGLVDWRKFTSLLKEIGYAGAVCVEHEDPVFSGQRRTEGLQKAYQVLRPLV